MCADEEVAVVGGGNSAGQAAVFLAGRARKVYLLIRGDNLGKSMSRYLVDRVEATENIELLADTEIRELLGDEVPLKGIVVENKRKGARHTLGTRSLFAFIGADANAGWFEGTLQLDDKGFVLTGTGLNRSFLNEALWPGGSREPILFETSLPGVFAVGDVQRVDQTCSLRRGRGLDGGAASPPAPLGGLRGAYLFLFDWLHLVGSPSMRRRFRLLSLRLLVPALYPG